MKWDKIKVPINALFVKAKAEMNTGKYALELSVSVPT